MKRTRNSSEDLTQDVRSKNERGQVDLVVRLLALVPSEEREEAATILEDLVIHLRSEVSR